MRMSMRRFTRLTNAFSKKLENQAHMVALYALWYNFVRIQQTLRTSPAMAAGIEKRLWSMEDVVRWSMLGRLRSAVKRWSVETRFIPFVLIWGFGLFGG